MPREGERVGPTVPLVAVHPKLSAGTHRLADRLDALDVRSPVPPDLDLERAEAHRDPVLSSGDRGVLVHDADRHVRGQPVETATEVCVEGQAGRLGKEIVDRHVDGGLCAGAPLRGPVHPVDDRPGSLELHPGEGPGNKLQCVRDRMDVLTGHLARSGTAVSRSSPRVDRDEDDLCNVRRTPGNREGFLPLKGDGKNLHEVDPHRTPNGNGRISSCPRRSHSRHRRF